MKKTVQISEKKAKKEDVQKSAIKLFNMYGYHGTSVRAIADDAGVNVALISYYFGGKKALLECLLTTFFEGYIHTMENAVTEGLENEPCVIEIIKKLSMDMMAFQQAQFYLSRLVYRELTIDSMLIREFMKTYLMKEKYLLEKVFVKGLSAGEIKPLPVFMLVMHFRELLMFPFLQPQYLRHVYFIYPTGKAFADMYLQYIDSWLSQISINRSKPLVSMEAL